MLLSEIDEGHCEGNGTHIQDISSSDPHYEILRECPYSMEMLSFVWNGKGPESDPLTFGKSKECIPKNFLKNWKKRVKMIKKRKKLKKNWKKFLKCCEIKLKIFFNK